VVQQGIWRIRTNQELRELHKYTEIIADIKKKRLEWRGQNQERTFTKIFKSKLEGRRRRRREDLD
jgi:hypothetical protein